MLASVQSGIGIAAVRIGGFLRTAPTAPRYDTCHRRRVRRAPDGGRDSRSPPVACTSALLGCEGADRHTSLSEETTIANPTTDHCYQQGHPNDKGNPPRKTADAELRIGAAE